MGSLAHMSFAQEIIKLSIVAEKHSCLIQTSLKLVSFQVDFSTVVFNLPLPNQAWLKPRFRECYTGFRCETIKRGWYVFWLFFKIGVYSAISFKRRGLSIDVAEHRSTMKNYPNTHYPRYSFMPKAGIEYPKTGVCFYCEQRRQRSEAYSI